MAEQMLKLLSPTPSGGDRSQPRPDQSAAEVVREDLVVQRPGSSFPAARYRGGAVHAEVAEDEGDHQGRSVQPDAAVGQDAIATLDQFGAELGDGVQAVLVGELAVV